MCLQAPKPARQAKEDDSEDASGSESDSDAQSEDEPAAAIRPNAAKQKAEASPRPAPAAANVPPKGVRARLQQSAADAAAKQEAADTARREAAQDAQPAAAIPTAAFPSPAAIAVTPEIQSSFRAPEPNLDLSASPTLPYDSQDMQTDSLPAPFDTQVSYTNADAAAFAALNAQTRDFDDAALASTSEDESAAQPDFPAAPAISTAEEPAAAAVGGAVKPTRGASTYKKKLLWNSGNILLAHKQCYLKLSISRATSHTARCHHWCLLCVLLPGWLQSVSHWLYTVLAAWLDKGKPLITRGSFAFAINSLLPMSDDLSKNSPSYTHVTRHVQHHLVQASTSCMHKSYHEPQT